jgi:lactoylglutathione lyase
VTFELAFNHVSLAVRDLDVSADFYGRLLGLMPVENLTRVQRIKWFSLGGGLTLHLIEVIGPGVDVRIKATHIALTATDFDAALAHLQVVGIAYGDLRGTLNAIQHRADGARQTYFQDPDGHWIEFVDRA